MDDAEIWKTYTFAGRQWHVSNQGRVPEPIVIHGGRLPPTRGLALEDISRGMAVEFDFQDSSVRKARP